MISVLPGKDDEGFRDEKNCPFCGIGAHVVACGTLPCTGSDGVLIACPSKCCQQLGYYRSHICRSSRQQNADGVKLTLAVQAKTQEAG